MTIQGEKATGDPALSGDSFWAGRSTGHLHGYTEVLRLDQESGGRILTDEARELFKSWSDDNFDKIIICEFETSPLAIRDRGSAFQGTAGRAQDAITDLHLRLTDRFE